METKQKTIYIFNSSANTEVVFIKMEVSSGELLPEIFIEMENRAVRDDITIQLELLLDLDRVPSVNMSSIGFELADVVKVEQVYKDRYNQHDFTKVEGGRRVG